ncbi:hypothetical protein D3C86_1560400 [compost metagenome]
MRPEQALVEGAGQQHGAKARQERLRRKLGIPGARRLPAVIEHPHEAERQVAHVRLRRGRLWATGVARLGNERAVKGGRIARTGDRLGNVKAQRRTVLHDLDRG